MNFQLIRSVVDNFRKSGIQSEAEVNTKFIYPLFQALGYPDECMAQEFPVYGYEGCRPLPAKNADFIYFSNFEFAHHRSNNVEDKKWVKDNSLLIVESKKPTKIPTDKGQAQFYTLWTRSLAYVETDGIQFMAYYHNTASSDLEIIDTTVDDLPNIQELQYIEYEYLTKVKNENTSVMNYFMEKIINDKDVRIITNDEDLDLPEKAISFFRDCLGKNSIGLTNVQVLSRFLNTTDCYLSNDLRYGVPPYMIDFPRHFYNAALYVDKNVFPIVSGQITEYYCDEQTRYSFESDFLDTMIILLANRVVAYIVDYHVHDKTVTERINKFRLIRQLFDTQDIHILIDNKSRTQISLPNPTTKEIWIDKECLAGLTEFWYQGMLKLKAIEDYYDIEFSLKQVHGAEEIKQLYDSIDIVFAGINLKENCIMEIPAEDVPYDIKNDYPYLFEEVKPIPVKALVIHGVVFKPYLRAILPSKISKRRKGILRIPACCEFRLDNN